MEHIERISRDLKYKGTMLDIYCDTVKNPNGHIAKWDFINHNGAAAVILVLPDGRIVLVRQYRNALDAVTYEIPAGGIEPGEDTKMAASRELEEEAGYKSNNLEFFFTLATAVAFCNEKIDIYIARNLENSKQNLDEDEFIDVFCFTAKEITDMILDGTIIDAKTIAAVMSYINKYVHINSNK